MISRIDKLDQNYFINGDIYYSQSIGNQSDILTNVNDYYFDMFISKYSGLWSSAPTLIRQNVSVPSELKLTRAMNYSGVTATDNTAQIVIEQRIESVFSKELSGEAASLGFHVENNLFQSVDIELFIADVEDDFGAVTQMGSTVTKSLTIGAFEKIVLENISMGTLSNGLSVRFTLKDPVDFVTVLGLSLTGFKLSKGTKAQEFSYMGKNVSDELRYCQRYFEKSYDLDVPVGLNYTSNSTGLSGVHSGRVNNSTEFYFSENFTSTKRITPAVLIYSPYTGVANKVRNLSTNGDANADPTGAGGHSFVVHCIVGALQKITWFWSANARL